MSRFALLERAGGEAAAGSGEGDVPREPDAEPAAETVAAENDEEDLGDEDSEEDEEDEEDDETEYAWLSEASEDSSDGEFIEDDEEDEDDAFDSEPSDFDDDAMHFEIEGDVDFVHDEDPEHAADPEADPGADGSDPSADPSARPRVKNAKNAARASARTRPHRTRAAAPPLLLWAAPSRNKHSSLSSFGQPAARRPSPELAPPFSQPGP